MIEIDGIFYETKRLHSLVEIARNKLWYPNSSFKHFSFILRRSSVLSIGWNDTTANPFRRNGLEFSYPLGGLHAELQAAKKLKDWNLISKCTLVNVRLNRKGELRNSKPCQTCLEFITLLGFRKIYYSHENGFNLMKINDGIVTYL